MTVKPSTNGGELDDEKEEDLGEKKNNNRSRNSSFILWLPCGQAPYAQESTSQSSLHVSVPMEDVTRPVVPLSLAAFFSACSSVSGWGKPYPRCLLFTLHVHSHIRSRPDPHLILLSLATASRPPQQSPALCTISQRLNMPTPPCLSKDCTRQASLLAYRSQHALSFLGSEDVYKLIDICGPLSSSGICRELLEWPQLFQRRLFGSGSVETSSGSQCKCKGRCRCRS